MASETSGTAADSAVRLQLIPLTMMTDKPPAPVRDVGGGFVSRLVVRGDDGAVVPTAADTQADPDPFSLAAELTYTRVLTGLDRRDHEAKGVRFRMLAIDGCPLVTTALLWPAMTAQLQGYENFLVAAPRLSAVLVRPIERQSDIGTATTLMSIARVVVGDADDPCCPDVLWWRQGRLHRIEFDPGDPQPVLPAELGDVAAALPL